MLRSSLFTAGAFALVASASAQTPQALSPEKMPSSVRHAGIYHVETGTWTRTGGEVANLGPDIVYSNVTASGYYSSAGGAGGFAPNSENFDEGSIPGTGNPGPFFGVPDRDEYSVNCVEIGYCDFGAPASGGFLIQFYNGYAPCTLAVGADAGILATGLPAGGCWIVEFDLSGGGEICIAADGDGVWDSGDPNLDSFGWSYTYAGTDGSAPCGFILTGNPEVSDPTWLPGGLPLDGSNTYYGQTNCVDEGTGYLTQDFWWIEDPMNATTMNSGCYWFGGYSNNNGLCTGPSNPYASWWLELAADHGACPDTYGTIYCNSNMNSTGVETGIILSGSQTAADDNCTITSFDMPNNSFGFFIVSETQGFVANPAGSAGNLCVLGAIGRFVGSGQIKNSMTNGGFSLSTPGEWSLTQTPTPMGPRMSVTGTTDNFQLWHRDVVGGAATSNFSGGISHTWL